MGSPAAIALVAVVGGVGLSAIFLSGGEPNPPVSDIEWLYDDAVPLPETEAQFSGIVTNNNETWSIENVRVVYEPSDDSSGTTEGFTISLDPRSLTPGQTGVYRTVQPLAEATANHVPRLLFDWVPPSD
jgi:hypothetical protein